MAYNLLKPVTIISAAAMTGNITSTVVETKNQDNIGFQLKWTGTPTGTFSVQISSDHLEDMEGNVVTPGNWISLPLSPAITAVGSADTAYIDINQTSALYSRLVYTFTSGTGSLTAIAVGKGV